MFGVTAAAKVIGNFLLYSQHLQRLDVLAPPRSQEGRLRIEITCELVNIQILASPKSENGVLRLFCLSHAPLARLDGIC